MVEDQWPIEIGNKENIVRGVCSPYHVSSKGKLRPEAYDPTPNTDEVSVMRADWIGDHACKNRAKSLENRSLKLPKVYNGLAVLSAEIIRQEGAELVDSRGHFPGHADIKHRVTLIAGEPLSPENTHAIRNRTKQLAKLANYHPDPEPDNNSWTGSPLSFQVAYISPLD